jgi:hypothetical protein
MAHTVQTRALAILVSVTAHAIVALTLWFLAISSRDVASGASTLDANRDLTLILLDDPETAASPTASGDEEQHDNEVGFPVKIGELTASAGPAPPAPVLVGNANPTDITTSAAGPAGSIPARLPGQRGLLEVPPCVRTVVYVVDRSLSMGLNAALQRARREVIASLSALPPETSFQIVFYNRQAEVLRVDGRRGFLPADVDTRQVVAQEIEGIAAEGGTDHVRALRTGLALRPDVLFFVTDADDLTDQQVRELTRFNDRRTIIHAIELSRRSINEDGPLHRLAQANGGTHRQVQPIP